jgi:hypothetical protein
MLMKKNGFSGVFETINIEVEILVDETITGVHDIVETVCNKVPEPRF